MSDKGRGGYPSDVTDKEWAFVLPYLLLCREDSPQRKHEFENGFQRRSVRGANGRPVAVPAARFAALVRGVSADAALAQGRVLRVAGGGRAFAAAPMGWSQGPADGGRDRQPHTAIDSGIGCAGGL